MLPVPYPRAQRPRPWPRLASRYATAQKTSQSSTAINSTRASTRRPPSPAPRQYIPTPPHQRLSRDTDHTSVTDTQEGKSPKKGGLVSRIFAFTPIEPLHLRAKDPARGLEASRRFIQEGVVDPRYRGVARRYISAIVALPLAIYLSYELYQRRFMGKKQKRPQVIGLESQTG